MTLSFGRDPYTTFGIPPDAVAWSALLVSIALFVSARRFPQAFAHLERNPSRVVAALATLAALLSAGYVAHYLRGGPRVIDATSYWLEARTLASGDFTFPALAPTGSFRGRFLVAPPGEPALAVIFPPGWPALLAIGFKFGAPLAVGPLIAAGLVFATYALARALFANVRIALCAAGASALCATLRYHTADTMSHGWSALLFCGALWGALGSRRYGAPLAGLCCGWLVATRPPTGVVVSFLCACVMCRARREQPVARSLLLLGLGAVPGVMLLAAHQRAATGEWFSSSQYYYYALADGPPGCFRYGFGAGIGCVHEHRDVVEAALRSGYGARTAFVTTLHRVLLNLIDIASAEPLALLLVAGAVRERNTFGVRLLASGVVLVILAYAPFYFPGSYPGGGARLLADALPLEHVLLGVAAARFRIGRYVAPIALAGFALHTSYAHRALADREGGRPMFEPALLERERIERGLVFVNTDHAFNLGHVPGADPVRNVVVARARKDAHDAALWESLGRPPSYLYRFDPFTPRRRPELTRYQPARDSSVRYEAENQWPPLAVLSGYAYPAYASRPCASGGRGLRLQSHQGMPARVVIELFVPDAGRYSVRTGWQADSTVPQQVRLQIAAESFLTVPLRVAGGCDASATRPLTLRAGPHRLELTALGPSTLLDYVELKRVN